MDIRELIGVTIKESRTRQAETHGNDHDNDDVAGAVLAALDKAGLVVVPREPTEGMVTSGKDAYMPPTTFVKYTTTMEEAWEAMIAASPYAKKEMAE